MTHAKPVLTLKRPKKEGRRPSANARVVKKAQAIQSAKVVAKAATRAEAAAPPAPPAITDGRFLAELQGVAPDLWKPDAPVPLAIGIHKQLYPIAERMQVSRRFLRRFLSRWTSTGAYQRAMSEAGATRLNLDGSAAGEVSEAHGERARNRAANAPPTLVEG